MLADRRGAARNAANAIPVSVLQFEGISIDRPRGDTGTKDPQLHLAVPGPAGCTGLMPIRRDAGGW